MRAADDGRRAVALTLGLLLVAALFTGLRLAEQLPLGQWWNAALSPDLDDPGELVFHFSSLPRLATALLCGGALGLAGALLQQVLRNPLASPTTLGIEAGSQLAVTVAVIAAPALLAGGREIASLAGATAATAAVFAGASARGLSSISVILSGLVVGLFCVALSASLKLVNEEYASVLFLWGGGSLLQQDWSAPAFLWPRLAILALVATVAVRPLSILSLDDDGARALGLPVAAVRLGGIALAVLLTASVTAAVGVIGFVGLAAPQLARFAGARRFGTRLALAPVVGAALLAAVDACVGELALRTTLALPTGAATALLGAPLLIWLLPRLRLAASPPAQGGSEPGGLHAFRAPSLLWLLAALLGGLLVALWIGRDAGGWTLAGPDEIGTLLPWRLPRTLVVLFAGAMLAAAGLVLQRLTGNPMAGPEILGLGTGVAAGLSVAMLLSAGLDPVSRFGAGAAGAFGALAILLAVGARSRFAPEHLLLAGIALSALLDAFVVSFLAVGDARALQLLAFVSGSTYRADWVSAGVTAALAVVLIPAALLRRWLDILPLGESSAASLGVPVARVRLALTGIAALLTTAAILVAGPLSFVGLMGPHAARLLGFRGAAMQLLAACLIGGSIMVAADWVGRVAIYPRQIPAGLVAALIGMPYLFWQLSRRRA
ncbi:Fe(3+)-hydroxamate ABC transporter permease FhuB [uncultured Enterovirga sp.]|uniref:Fe(3+)-hydroxamate ABC transporter permease FhuB n=1 Tax=uncultured Enterovirga sp. TaxID=2026352 RepID=UPI0035CC8024